MGKTQAAATLIDDAHMPIPVALDDGHSMGKLAMLEHVFSGRIVERSFRSRTVVGLQDLDAEGRAVAAAYFHSVDRPDQASPASGNVLTVMQSASHDQAADNRTSDYPTSPRNLVLVHHALHSVAGASGPVHLGTTLPYSDYHLPGGVRNTPLIDAKKANLSRPVFPLDPATMSAVTPAYDIVQQTVFSEGIAAFFDSMLDWDHEHGELTINGDFAQRFSPDLPTFAVVDIGGKTTDIVYGGWTGAPDNRPAINIPRSESLTAGILDAADSLTDSLKRRFGVKTVRDAEQALSRRDYALFGSRHSINDEVEQATRDLFAKIRNAVLRHAGDGSDLACVLFVGGGAELLRDELGTMFPKAMTLVPERPSFANARGMLKLLLTARA